MTNSRYSRLKEISIETVKIDCPVEITKGALLLDNDINKTLLQLKLLNISDKSVTSVFIKVFCFDAAGDEIIGIEPVEFAYLDIDVNPKATFGERTPVVLDSMVRNVKISIEKVTTKDGSTWRNYGKPIDVPVMKPLQELKPDLYEQLIREATETQIDKSILLYFPVQSESYWSCSCGRLNPNIKDECMRCGISKEWIFTHINTDYLTMKLSKQNEKEQHLAEIKKREIENLQHLSMKKRKKFIIIAISSIPVIVILLFAQSFIAKGKYDDAYITAVGIYESGDYLAAIEQFGKLNGYLESKKMIREARYKHAVYLYNDNLFYEAREYFNLVEGFGDTKKYLDSDCYKIEGVWRAKNIDGKPAINTIEFRLNKDGEVGTHGSAWAENLFEYYEWSDTNLFHYKNGNFPTVKIMSVNPVKGGELILEWNFYDSNGDRRSVVVYEYISN